MYCKAPLLLPLAKGEKTTPSPYQGEVGWGLGWSEFLLMKKPIKLALCSVLYALLIVPHFVFASNFSNSLKTSAESVAKGALGISGFGDKQPEDVVLGVITVLLGFLGVIFLVLTIYGAWLWMTARGNEEQTTKARKIVFDAIVGLLVITAAYMVTYWIGEFVFGVTSIGIPGENFNAT